MLAARFLKAEPVKVRRTAVRFPRYNAFLNLLLNHKWKVIGATVLLVAGTLLLLPKLGSEFIPSAGARDFVVEVQLPEGTELNRTADAVASMEQVVRGTIGKDLGTLYSVIGPSNQEDTQSSGTVQDENTATMRISLAATATILPEEVVSRLSKALSNIPDARIQVSHEQTALDISLGTESAPLVVEIRGEDMDTLQRLTAEVKSKIAVMPDLQNVRTSFDEGRPEVEVVLDRERAGVLNVGISELSSRLTEYLTGTSAGQWESGGEMKNITVELPRPGVNQIGDILLTTGGRQIPVSEVAGIRMVEAPKEINRRDQVRVGMVTADLNHERPLDQVVADLRSKLSGVTFPQGYRYEVTGEEGQRRESFDNMKFALILSLALMFMVLASQFESLVHPFTIMLAVPTAAVGTILLFFVMGEPLSVMAYIGIIMLMGIAVNDSIVLVDAILQLRRAGVPCREAILEAGQRRLRPIIMTSLTTILGMLPLTFGLGEGTALRAPMALAVVGGMISSSLLTLGVIPCFFMVLDRLAIWGPPEAKE